MTVPHDVVLPLDTRTLRWASIGTKDPAVGERYETTDRLAVTLDDLKTCRQAGSRCTGHPEYGRTARVVTPLAGRAPRA